MPPYPLSAVPLQLAGSSYRQYTGAQHNVAELRRRQGDAAEGFSRNMASRQEQLTEEETVCALSTVGHRYNRMVLQQMAVIPQVQTLYGSACCTRALY